MSSKRKEDKGYEPTTPWRKLPRWKCTRCQFDSLDEEAVQEHVRTVHSPPPQRRIVQTPLVDRFHNPIVKVEEVRNG